MTFPRLVYDSRRDDLIAFSHYYTFQTWRYDVSSGIWTNLSPAASPTPRHLMGVAYDSESDRVIIFGGRNAAGNAMFQETWAYDVPNNTWLNRAPASPPGVRMNMGMGYDVDSDLVVMFGGCPSPVNCDSGLLGDTWTYNHNTNTWLNKAPSSPPIAQSSPSLAYDTRRDRFIMHGAYCGGCWDYNTYQYDLDNNTWTDLNPSGLPNPRYGAAFGYDWQSDRFILYGGCAPSGTCGWNTETHIYSRSTNAWRQMVPSSNPGQRSYAMMGYSPPADRAFIFGGGVNGIGQTDHTWYYEIGTTPGGPTGLTAQPGPTQAVLNWTAPASDGGAPITGYRIYRGTVSGGETFLLQVGNVLTYTNTGLTNGQPYFYKVSAVNDMGEGPQSNEASATPIAVPSAARSLAAAGGDNQITLNWIVPIDGGGSPITNYRVYRGATSGGETFYVEIGNVLTYVDAGVINGQTWFYKVSAKNSIGEGPLSNEASATAGAPPTEPWSLSAVAGNARATLYWNPPNSSGGTPITNHRIYRGTTSGALSLLLEIGNVSTYLNLGLTNGQVYYYQVSAKSAAQEGARSAEVSVIPATVPGSPLNVQASPGDAQVTLNWSPPASSNGRPLIGYRVYRGTSSGTYTWNATLGLVNTYVSSGLTNGVRYYYAVSATNAMGEGSLSSEVSAIPAQFPSEPWDLNTGPGNQRVTLGWNAPNSTGGPPISNYRLYRGFTSGNLSFLAEIGNLTSYIDGGLTNGVTYHYAVSARNGVREGPRSNVVWEIPANIPSAPLAPNATAGEGNATLEWSPPSDNGGRPVTGYKVYRGNSSGVYTWNATVPVSNSYLFTGLTNGVRHYFVVAAINPAGEGPKSQEVSAVPSRIPIPPTVTGTWPLNGTVGITLDSSVIVTFSLPMDPNSTVAAFSITPTVAGGSTATGPQNLTFTHASPFAPNTIYTVTIAKSAKSAVGDAMSWAYWTTFATGTAAKPPQVSSTDPADGAGNVALDYNITVEFDAAMDDVSTIGAVTIYPSIFPAFGNVTGTTLIITHLLVFQPKATYFVNISTAAKSVAGANLGAPYTFSFTTAPLGGGVDPAKIVFTVPQSVIDIGKSTDFYYNVYDAAGRPIGTKDKWDYAPKDVATVEYLGGHRFTVTGLQVGKVKITVTAEGDSATVANFTTLEVRDPGAPPPPDESPIPGVPLWALLGGLAAVIAVAGLLALLLLRKRKRKDLPSPFATSHVAPSGAPSQDQAPPQGYYRPAEAAPAWQPPPPPPPPPAPAFHPEGSVAAAIDVAESRPAPPPRPRRRPGPPGA